MGKYLEIAVVFSLLLSTILLTSNLSTALSDKKLGLERVKLLNKEPVKTFLTKYGEKLDCIPIHKQVAFDHPLLINHTIQMKPSRDFDSMMATRKVTSGKIIPPKRITYRCPQGTVIVKRIDEGDLLDILMPSMGMGYELPTSNIASSKNSANVAHVYLEMENYGVSGELNLWTPATKMFQFSSSTISVSSEQNAIFAGWAVDMNPLRNYTTPATRLFSFWTKDGGVNTGCYNNNCPGFVHVQSNSSYTLGQILNPISEYNGDQYILEFSISQDPLTNNWWLIIQKESVGYWPNALFSTLAEGGNRLGWGGNVHDPVKVGNPGMGSGHFADEGFKKAAYIKNMMYNDHRYEWVRTPTTGLRQYVSSPSCFTIKYLSTWYWGQSMYFGGPPDCNDLT